MTAWRTFACSVALCFAVSGCGDDGEATGFAGSNASANTDASSTSSSTGNSTGTPSTTTPDPTTGDPSTSTTAPSPTTTTAPQTTGEPDTTTTGPDTTTTTNTTQTTDPAGCGNGSIDPNEQCDGVNLNGFTCESLGNAGGSLGCDPVTCTFDTSMCTGNSTSGTSG